MGGWCGVVWVWACLFLERIMPFFRTETSGLLNVSPSSLLRVYYLRTVLLEGEVCFGVGEIMRKITSTM